MDPVHVALFAALIPALVVGAVLLVLRRLGRGTGAAAVAVVLGLAAGLLGVDGLRFPPREQWHWVLPLAIAAGGVAALEAWVPRLPPWTRRGLRSGLVAMVGLVAPVHPTVGAAAAIAAATVAALATLDGVARGVGPRSGLVVALILAIGSALSLGWSGWALGAQLAGAVAAGLGACLVLAFRRPIDATGLATAVVPPLALVVVCGLLYAELPPASLALLAAAPVAASLPLPAAWRSKARIVGPAFAAVLAGAAVAVAIHDSPTFDY